MNDANGNVETIFAAALKLATPSERAAFLEGVCQNDQTLRERVELLLMAHDEAGSFLRPTHESLISARDPSTQHNQRETGLIHAARAEIAVAQPPAIEKPGARIGPYKLLERIGEGGFGTVYMAEQDQPIHRRVALKIIKLGMDTRQVVARFEAERQALAMMDHAHIARVLDAGATDSGRPYFVMDLVRGTPITAFCDEQRLTIRQRLDLFVQVCHAVQHAHIKGVIHRDLKPSNILAVRHDGTPVAKVIDFGIAKATGGRLTDKTVFTEFRQLIGTPAYMSPEQAGMSDIDIDTRSDIYSLGVLLYELMTGTTPFDAKSLLGSGYDEMRRIIREVEPPKPSTRVSSLSDAATKRRSDGGIQSPLQGEGRGEGKTDDSAAAALPKDSALSTQHSVLSDDSALTIARCRHTDPAALSRMLRGDLDWIVMKCLDKDRTRRYETANGLAQEIERYLKNEPVLAGPPSRFYRFRKFVRRNRTMVTAAALVAASLLAGMAGTTYGLLRAEQRRVEAEAARGREREQRELAEKREKLNQQVADFQAAMLSDIDVEAMGRGIKDHFREQVRAALERQYVGEYPNRRKRSPEEVEAELAAYDERADAAQAADVARRVMDEYVLARAADALEKQFGDQPLVQAQIQDSIGMTYVALGLYNAAESHVRSALEIRRRELGDEHELVAASLNNVATLLQNQGDYAAAEPLFRESLVLDRKHFGDEHPTVAQSLNNLAVLLSKAGKRDEAEPLLREALALDRKLQGEGHPSVAIDLCNLGTLLCNKGDYAAAEPLFRKALELDRRHRGDAHPHLAQSLNDLGALFHFKGDYAAAEPLFRESLALRRKLLGDEHPDVGESLNNLAMLLQAKADYVAAEPLFREALELARRLQGREHPDVVIGLNNLALLLRDKGDYAAAEPLLREALALGRTVRGDEHPDVASELTQLAGVLLAMGDRAGAEPLLREALALYRESPGHVAMAETLNNMARLMQANGDYAAAEPLFQEALAIRRKLLGDEHRLVAESLGNLAMFLQDQGDYAAAEPLAREALKLYRKSYGDAHPHVATGLNNLATLLQARGDYAAAEPLVREALTLYRKLLGDEHPHVAAALNNLARLLHERGDYAAAEPLAREAVARFRRLHGDEHALVATSLSNLALVLHRKGDLTAAEPLYREALTMRRRVLADGHPDLAESLGNLAALRSDRGEQDEAESLYRESLAILRGAWGDEHPTVAQCLNNLGTALVHKGDSAGGEAMLRQALAIERRLLGDDHPQLVGSLSNLANVLLGARRYADAQPVFREALELARSVMGDEHPNTQYPKLGLAQALTELGQFAEAEALLLDLAEQSERVEAKRQFRWPALKSLVRLYEVWHTAEPEQGYGEKAAQWRTTLAAWEKGLQERQSESPADGRPEDK